MQEQPVLFTNIRKTESRSDGNECCGENKARTGDRSGGVGGVLWKRVCQEGLPEKVTFEQRPEG